MQTFPISDVRHPSPVLSFADTVLPLSGMEGEVFSLDLDLYPGELMILQAEDAYHEETLVRASCGLTTPLSGAVRFLGRDWRELSPDRANASRARIGIAFRDDSWLPYQTILDSLVLPHLHHTRRSRDEICREATFWASRFGLPGLPGDIPSAVSAEDRRCANLVRAFVGSPSLIILEHQSKSLAPPLLESVINAMGEARERDAAVLWLSHDLSFGLDETIPATRRLRLDGSLLSPLEAAA